MPTVPVPPPAATSVPARMKRGCFGPLGGGAMERAASPVGANSSSSESGGTGDVVPNNGGGRRHGVHRSDCHSGSPLRSREQRGVAGLIVGDLSGDVEELVVVGAEPIDPPAIPDDPLGGDVAGIAVLEQLVGLLEYAEGDELLAPQTEPVIVAQVCPSRFVGAVGLRSVGSWAATWVNRKLSWPPFIRQRYSECQAPWRTPPPIQSQPTSGDGFGPLAVLPCQPPGDRWIHGVSSTVGFSYTSGVSAFGFE